MRLDLAISYYILDVKSYISKRRDLSTRLRSVTDCKMVILWVGGTCRSIQICDFIFHHSSHMCIYVILWDQRLSRRGRTLLFSGIWRCVDLKNLRETLDGPAACICRVENFFVETLVKLWLHVPLKRRYFTTLHNITLQQTAFSTVFADVTSNPVKPC